MNINNRFLEFLKRYQGEVTYWLIMFVALSFGAAQSCNIIIAVFLGALLSTYATWCLIIVRLFLGWWHGLFFVPKDQKNKTLSKDKDISESTKFTRRKYD